MDRCINCKHWKRIHGDELQDDSQDYDCNVFMVEIEDEDSFNEFAEPEYPIGICNTEQGFYKPPKVDGFALADGENYRATIATGGEFGCTRWEAKE